MVRSTARPRLCARESEGCRWANWFSHLKHSPAQIASDHKNSVRKYWEHNFDLANWMLMRRIYSERIVLEQMATFLGNILHISSQEDSTAPYRFDYEQTIRKHAFGRFEDLLIEASLHPAMRMYLDNRLSVKGKPNENQGRELLELHSVSRTAAYTEAMVLDSAKILSGYTVDWGKTYNAYYDPNKHTTGPVSVLGFSDPNGSADGQNVAIRYLKYLANHPSTAQTLARRMATFFVSDQPSNQLINLLAATYSSSGTSLKAMLRNIASSPEFLNSEGSKVRSPRSRLHRCRSGTRHRRQSSHRRWRLCIFSPMGSWRVATRLLASPQTGLPSATMLRPSPRTGALAHAAYTKIRPEAIGPQRMSPIVRPPHGCRPRH